MEIIVYHQNRILYHRALYNIVDICDVNCKECKDNSYKCTKCITGLI